MTAVESVNGDRVILQEGLAAGFTAGSELVKATADAPRLRIDSVDLSALCGKSELSRQGQIQIDCTFGARLTDRLVASV